MATNIQLDFTGGAVEVALDQGGTITPASIVGTSDTFKCSETYLDPNGYLVGVLNGEVQSPDKLPPSTGQTLASGDKVTFATNPATTTYT